MYCMCCICCMCCCWAGVAVSHDHAAAGRAGGAFFTRVGPRPKMAVTPGAKRSSSEEDDASCLPPVAGNTCGAASSLVAATNPGVAHRPRAAAAAVSCSRAPRWPPRPVMMRRFTAAIWSASRLRRLSRSCAVSLARALPSNPTPKVLCTTLPPPPFFFPSPNCWPDSFAARYGAYFIARPRSSPQTSWPACSRFSTRSAAIFFSSPVISVKASPVAPARPVLPTRCVWVSMSRAVSKDTTV
mmetsp:Transcript_94555/g.267647  ORF Transcript_94555/g.267647 Transcript_94555/m.267647 type:complete len:242 (-) Transcript_94555:1321-2046(-)